MGLRVESNRLAITFMGPGQRKGVRKKTIVFFSSSFVHSFIHPWLSLLWWHAFIPAREWVGGTLPLIHSIISSIGMFSYSPDKRKEREWSSFWAHQKKKLYEKLREKKTCQVCGKLALNAQQVEWKLVCTLSYPWWSAALEGWPRPSNWPLPPRLPPRPIATLGFVSMIPRPGRRSLFSNEKKTLIR